MRRPAVFDAQSGARRGGNDRIMRRRTFTSTNIRWVPIFLAVLLAFVAGCASTPEPADEEPGEAVDSEFNDAANQAPEVVEDTNISNSSLKIAPVYFDFDRSEIRSEFEPILGSAARDLKDRNATVVIEGHTDERGSADYNVALGERRAGAVRKYLYNLGVPMGQMTIVSYGEAQPAVSGTGETAWQLNRRAEFRVR
jgi:peptidoglycan-associated lipoprotein